MITPREIEDRFEEAALTLRRHAAHPHRPERATAPASRLHGPTRTRP